MPSRRERINADVDVGIVYTLAMAMCAIAALCAGPLPWWFFPLAAAAGWMGLLIKALVGGYRDDPR